MHDYYHLWNISIWIEKIGFFNQNNNSLKYYLLSLPLGTNTEKSMNLFRVSKWNSNNSENTIQKQNRKKYQGILS